MAAKMFSGQQGDSLVSGMSEDQVRLVLRRTQVSLLRY